jgi:hypothetical protein
MAAVPVYVGFYCTKIIADAFALHFIVDQGLVAIKVVSSCSGYSFLQWISIDLPAAVRVVFD